MMPEIISPRIPGILNFLNRTGDISITRSIIANTKTGSFTGNSVMLLIYSPMKSNNQILNLMISPAI